MEQDIYLITPELEAKVLHALSIIDSYVEYADSLGKLTNRERQLLVEAADSLKALPFIKNL